MRQFLLLLCCISLVQARSQNSSILFDGTSQYIGIASQASIGLSSQFTIEGWIYPTGAGSHNDGGIIVNKENSYEISRFADGTIRFALSGSGGGADWNWVNTGFIAPVNVWTHFAMVKNGSTVTFYFNGNQFGSFSGQPATLAPNSMELRLAGRVSYPQFFKGALDDIRLWNTARTQQEIKRFMYSKNLPVNATGLIADYKMNEAAGSTTVINSCTNAASLNGTVASAVSRPVSPTQFSSNALDFDGVDDHMSVPHNASLNATSSLTIEAVVYATKSTGSATILYKGNNASDSSIVFGRSENGWADIHLGIRAGGSWHSISAPGPGRDVWHHLAATYDGAELKMYINGNLVASKPVTGAIATNANDLMIGKQFTNISHFGGRIDEVRIWNVARSQAEIKANINRELQPDAQSGLISYYTFNKANSDDNNAGMVNIVDQAGNNNGTLNNFSLSGTSSNYREQGLNLITLPVNLTDFKAGWKGLDVTLNWTMTSAFEVREFVVEHSRDNRSWNVAGSVINSLSGKTGFDFVHAQPGNGKNFYRLQVISLNGKKETSKTLQLNDPRKPKIFQLESNHVIDGNLRVHMNTRELFMVYYADGRMVKKEMLNPGRHLVQLTGLPAGMYLVGSGEQVERLIVN